MRSLYILPLLLLSVMLHPLTTHARDHVIPSDLTIVDGSKLGVEPGDRMLIAAGPRRSLRLRNLNGSSEAPITIINHGGQVVINDDQAYAGISIDHCYHLRLTGTGDASVVYGFHLTGTNSHGSGVIAAGLSSDLEIDHLHIQDTGFAGMLIKTDGAVGTFMDNINLHHNYIHDTGGEGFYIGQTHYPAQIFRHLQVWNNVVARTGWEALQLANCEEDVRVHHNIFYDAGRAGVLWQENNLQFTCAVNAQIDHNIVIGSGANLIIASGGMPKRFHDNYLANDQATGPVFYFEDSRFDPVPDTALIVENNFINLTPTRQPVVLFSGRKSRLSLSGNIWQGTSTFVKTHRDVDLSGVTKNTQTDLVAPTFIDPKRGDFRLRPDDPYLARNIGLLPDWLPPSLPSSD